MIQVTTENPDPAQATLTQPVPTEADAQNLMPPQVVDLPTVPSLPVVPVPMDLASSQSMSTSMSSSSSPLPKPALLRPSSRSSTPSEVVTPTSDLINDATAAAQSAVQLSKQKEYEGKSIVVLLPDTGERYLSTALWNE